MSETRDTGSATPYDRLVIEAAINYVGFEAAGGTAELPDPNVDHFGALLEALSIAGYDIDGHGPGTCALCHELEGVDGD